MFKCINTKRAIHSYLPPLSGIQGILSLCNNEGISAFTKISLVVVLLKLLVQRWMSETGRHVNKVVNSTRADIEMD